MNSEVSEFSNRHLDVEINFVEEVESVHFKFSRDSEKCLFLKFDAKLNSNKIAEWHVEVSRAATSHPPGSADFACSGCSHLATLLQTLCLSSIDESAASNVLRCMQVLLDVETHQALRASKERFAPVWHRS